uniref:Uncharacterized protein n=1 Tax=Prolemur simus TaxID=1328070 RepID=A0A8C9DE75_PROSS
MPCLSEGASGSIVSSVLVCFFRACNTFKSDPSVFPRDASSPVKKEETGFDHGRLMEQLFFRPQPYIPVKEIISHQTGECHSERRKTNPNLNL